MRVGDRDRSMLVSEADILVKFMSLVHTTPGLAADTTGFF